MNSPTLEAYFWATADSLAAISKARMRALLDFLLYERLISSIEVVELVDDAVAVGTHIAHYSSFHMASSLTGVDVAGIVDGCLVSDVL